VDIATWIAAGAAGGTFLLEPVLSLIRSGRRDRAYARFNQMLELREKAEQHGILSPHLTRATDEAMIVVRNRIVASELGFALRKGRGAGLLRRMVWQTTAVVVCAGGIFVVDLSTTVTGPAWLVWPMACFLVTVLLGSIGVAAWIELDIGTAVERFVNDESATLPHRLLHGVAADRRPGRTPALQRDALAVESTSAPDVSA
jgi:hypothetical protein